MTCLFCDNIQNVIYQTENFYVKIGKGIITAGHLMIIPKKHCKTIADISNLMINEYLDLKKLVTEKVTEEFCKPFFIEYGVFGQSVFHGHIHIIPSSGNNYENVNIIEELALPAIKKYNLNYNIINNFNELKQIFNKDKEYVYFEFDNIKYVLRIKKFVNEKVLSENILKEDDVSYRHFFQNKKHLIGIGNWKTMTDEDIKIDNEKIEETRKKIIL